MTALSLGMGAAMIESGLVFPGWKMIALKGAAGAKARPSFIFWRMGSDQVCDSGF